MTPNQHRSFSASAAIAVLALAVLPLTGCSSAPSPAGGARAAERGLPTLQFLGTARLPADAGAGGGGAPVGGLSALAYQPSTGVWYALSDDRGEQGPPRFYTLRIELTASGFGAEPVTVLGATPLLAPGGGRFAAGTVDPEGLAVSEAGTLFVSSEGVARDGVDPWVRELRLDGVPLRELPLPAYYLPREARGVRDNLGFEGLSLSPDGTELFAALENGLAQDGPAADAYHGSSTRILRFDRASGEPLAEYAYQVERVPVEASERGDLEVAGISEILALGGGRLLVLERAYAAGRGNTVRLYLAELAGAGDVLGDERLSLSGPRRCQPLRKPSCSTSRCSA